MLQNDIDAAIEAFKAKGGRIQYTSTKTVNADDDFILATEDCQLELETDYTIAA